MKLWSTSNVVDLDPDKRAEWQLRRQEVDQLYEEWRLASMRATDEISAGYHRPECL